MLFTYTEVVSVEKLVLVAVYSSEMVCDGGEYLSGVRVVY